MYTIDTDSVAREQIAALPATAPFPYSEVIDVLMLTPWNGVPYNDRKPDGIMRTPLFGDGRGKVTYLIVEDQQRVDVLTVLWFE